MTADVTRGSADPGRLGAWPQPMSSARAKRIEKIARRACSSPDHATRRASPAGVTKAARRRSRTFMASTAHSDLGGLQGYRRRLHLVTTSSCRSPDPLVVTPATCHDRRRRHARRLLAAARTRSGRRERGGVPALLDVAQDASRPACRGGSRNRVGVVSQRSGGRRRRLLGRQPSGTARPPLPRGPAHSELGEPGRGRASRGETIRSSDDNGTERPRLVGRRRAIRTQEDRFGPLRAHRRDHADGTGSSRHGRRARRRQV